MPTQCVTSARLGCLVSRGQSLQIREEECFFIRALDEQIKSGKSLFGSGFLISYGKAEEIEEKLKLKLNGNIMHFELSDREKEIIEKLSNK